MVNTPKRDTKGIFLEEREGPFLVVEGGLSNVNDQPLIDMFSTPDKIVIEVELAGVKREDIDLAIHHNTLAIRGLKEDSFDEERINFVCMERNLGRFFRTIELPHPVDTTGIKATYRNGLLTIILPRVDERRGMPRKIPVEG